MSNHNLLVWHYWSQHDLHQVNGLASQLAKEYSTQVDKTMPFSYPKVHSSSGTELISQSSPSKQAIDISSKSNITINTVIPNCTKICNKTMYQTIQQIWKVGKTTKELDPQQSRHFSVAVYSSLYDLLTKSKAKYTKIESPLHFYLSKGMVRKRTKTYKVLQTKLAKEGQRSG